jgi:hypothetical protein
MNAMDVALGFTLGYEGEWVNDPDDRGGETYRGISRVHWPKWAGWAIIDAEKQNEAFPSRLMGMSFGSQSMETSCLQRWRWLSSISP